MKTLKSIRKTLFLIFMPFGAFFALNNFLVIDHLSEMGRSQQMIHLICNLFIVAIVGLSLWYKDKNYRLAEVIGTASVFVVLLDIDSILVLKSIQDPAPIFNSFLLIILYFAFITTLYAIELAIKFLGAKENPESINPAT